ncbi:DNA pilot protein [Microviridae sp.]|nr:DNA pilot protein [Microviridae sp.]
MYEQYNNITDDNSINTPSSGGGSPWGTVAGIVATGVNVWAQSKQNQLNREFAEEQSKIAYERNLSQWHRQNAYNDPSAQMARLKAAGLNPMQVYGKGSHTANTASNSPKREIAKYQGVAPKVDPMLIAQVNLMNAQTESVRLDNFDKKELLGLTPTRLKEDGTAVNINYARKFNEAVKSAEDALSARELRKWNELNVSAKELENAILQVRKDLADTGINFSNDNPIVRALVTTMAKQGLSVQEAIAWVIKQLR